MAQTWTSRRAGMALIAIVMTGTVASLYQGEPARANTLAGPGSIPKLVEIRVESATHLIGVGGTTPLRVIGVMSGGATRILRPREVKLHVSPAHGGRILANHTLYPRTKGDLHVHATAGNVKSKPLFLEAVPF